MQVTVAIWHDADDSCGERCSIMGKFLQKLETTAVDLEAADSRITFEPHYLFHTWDKLCSDRRIRSAEECDRNCINGRYVSSASVCARPPSAAQGSKPGQQARRLCQPSSQQGERVWRLLPPKSPTAEQALAVHTRC